MERLHDVWNDLLVTSSFVPNQVVEYQVSRMAFLDRNDCDSFVHHSDLCRWYYPRPDVASSETQRRLGVRVP